MFQQLIWADCWGQQQRFLTPLVPPEVQELLFAEVTAWYEVPAKHASPQQQHGAEDCQIKSWKRLQLCLRLMLRRLQRVGEQRQGHFSREIFNKTCHLSNVHNFMNLPSNICYSEAHLCVKLHTGDRAGRRYRFVWSWLTWKARGASLWIRAGAIQSVCTTKVSSLTKRRGSAALQSAFRHQGSQLCGFFHICLTHEETHESIAVIHWNSVVSLWGGKIKTEKDIQTFCPAVAFQKNQVIVIHITSRFIHGHGSSATSLAISQILLLCRRYVTAPLNIRGHCHKYRRPVPLAGSRRLWRELRNLFFTCGVSLSVRSRCESVWVWLIIPACIFSVWSTFRSCLETSFVSHERKAGGIFPFMGLADNDQEESGK